MGIETDFNLVSEIIRDFDEPRNNRSEEAKYLLDSLKEALTRCNLGEAILYTSEFFELLTDVQLSLYISPGKHGEDDKVENFKSSLLNYFTENVRKCPFTPPSNVKEGLIDSMAEETEAASRYSARAEAAMEEGDVETKNLYDHVIAEENEHYDEFKNRVNEIENPRSDVVTQAELRRRAMRELGIEQ